MWFKFKEISLSKSFKTPWRNEDRFLGTDKSRGGAISQFPFRENTQTGTDCRAAKQQPSRPQVFSRTGVVDRVGFPDVRFPITVEVSLVVGADC